MVVIEIDDALFRLCDWQTAPATFSSKLEMIKPGTLDAMGKALSDLLQRQIKKIVPISLNAGRLLYQSAYQLLYEHAENELRRFWRNQSTLLFMCRLWIRNLISNMKSPDLAIDIKDHPRHRSVVLVGAGPSLNQSIKLLKNSRSEFFLVCVDTAIPSLVRNGIVPDLVIALEGQLANLKDFIPAGQKLPALAYDLTSCPLVHRHIAFSYHWLFSSDFAPGTHWKALNDLKILPTRIPALGSVGVASLYLCQFLASEHIFITGLDFSWFPGATHAQDSPSRLAFLQQSQRLHGNFGELSSLREDVSSQGYCTDKILCSYRDSLDEVIGHLKQYGLKIHDLRRSGLPINAKTCSDADFEQIVRSNLDTGIPQLIKTISEVPLFTREARKMWLHNLTQQIKNCLKLLDDYLHHVSIVGDDHLLSALTELNFLFHELPDRDWPNLNPSALIRARVILDYYYNFILQKS